MTKKRQPERPSVREEQKLRTRQRLLDAGASVFAKHGYGTSSVDALAEAAGVSRATFYLHFPSKLRLMEELIETLQPEINALYDFLLEGPRTRERVKAFLERAFEFYAANREIISASTQAEAVDPLYSKEIEVLTFELGRRVVGKSASEARVLRAGFAVQELDRLAYFHSVRGWRFERDEAVALLVPHWLDL